jgi:hypothetical protein
MFTIALTHALNPPFSVFLFEQNLWLCAECGIVHYQGHLGPAHGTETPWNWKEIHDFGREDSVVSIREDMGYVLVVGR